MFGRKIWIAVVFSLLLIVSPTVCSAQEIQLPDRVIEVKLETALAAQEAAMQELLAGGELQINMTEEEFSSLLTFFLAQNLGEFNPVEEIKVWFEEDQEFFAEISLLDGTLPDGFTSDKLILAGTIEEEVQNIQVRLNSPKRVGRFGLASLVAQESDAEEKAEEKADAAEEAADEAEKAIEESADAAEAALRDVSINISEASLGGVPVPDYMLSMISQQLSIALAPLTDAGVPVSVTTASGEININF